MSATLQQRRAHNGADAGGMSAAAAPTAAVQQPYGRAPVADPTSAGPVSSQPATPLAAERDLRVPHLEQAISMAQQSTQDQSAQQQQQQPGVAPQAAADSDDCGSVSWFTMWRHNLELDQLFYCLAAGMWVPYFTRLWTVSTPAERVQHISMAANIVSLAVLSWRAPVSFYRRWSPLLRIGILVHAFCLPFFSSIHLFNGHASAPAHSWLPGLLWLLDAYQLWMAGRGALVGFALVGARPPLHIAVPAQLLGLWRVHATNFCRADILQHPIMRQRTRATHAVLTLASQALGFQTIALVSGQDSNQQCRSLMLFISVLINGLVPLLLLLPLSRAGSGNGGGRPAARHVRWLQALDRRLESGLMWLACGGTQLQRSDEDARDVLLCTLRRLVMLATLWLACCILES